MVYYNHISYLIQLVYAFFFNLEFPISFPPILLLSHKIYGLFSYFHGFLKFIIIFYFQKLFPVFWFYFYTPFVLLTKFFPLKCTWEFNFESSHSFPKRVLFPQCFFFFLNFPSYLSFYPHSLPLLSLSFSVYCPSQDADSSSIHSEFLGETGPHLHPGFYWPPSLPSLNSPLEFPNKLLASERWIF